jgi:hypothetical protein
MLITFTTVQKFFLKVLAALLMNYRDMRQAIVVPTAAIMIVMKAGVMIVLGAAVAERPQQLLLRQLLRRLRLRQLQNHASIFAEM